MSKIGLITTVQQMGNSCLKNRFKKYFSANSNFDVKILAICGIIS